MTTSFDVKNRLAEMTRRDEELSATSLALTGMASQLERLRELAAKQYTRVVPK